MKKTLNGLPTLYLQDSNRVTKPFVTQCLFLSFCIGDF